jgi:hypothetical protein
MESIFVCFENIEIQTPIHEEVEKMKNLLRSPAIFRNSQLYPYQLNLKIQSNKFKFPASPSINLKP